MIRNALQRFMYGRYGNDQLNMASAGPLFGPLSHLFFTGFDPLYWISFAVILFALFRMLSPEPGPPPGGERQIPESCRTAIQWFRLRRTIHRDKEHCYFKCPNCGPAAPGAPGARERSPSPAAAAAPSLKRRAEYRKNRRSELLRRFRLSKKWQKPLF